MKELERAVSILCVLTVLCTALDMLMPEGTVRRYAKFVFALTTMLVLLSPVLQVLTMLTENLP